MLIKEAEQRDQQDANRWHKPLNKSDSRFHGIFSPINGLTGQTGELFRRESWKF